MTEQFSKLDHPIFIESIRRIKAQLDVTDLDPLQQQVLERIVHSSGDFGIQYLLRFSNGACQSGVFALCQGAPILTDTAMALAGVKPMAGRTLNSIVRCVLDWAPEHAPQGSTRTAIGMRRAWLELSSEFKGDRSPIVLIGSAPMALSSLLDLVLEGALAPSLIIGMPVGFVGVLDSKHKLINSTLPYISIDGTRGGAGLAAAAINALLRASMRDQ